MILEQLKLPGLPERLPRPMIDNHTHLQSTQEYSGLPVTEAVDLARQVNITRIVDVGCDVESSRQAVEHAAKFPGVKAAVALHPNDAARIVERRGADALTEDLQVIDELAGLDGVRGVGETGLDYFRTKDRQLQAVQAQSFAEHIEIARRHDRTLVIHDRDAHSDVLKVLDEHDALPRVVMHCFSGDADFARECVARGYFLSFPGVVTFGSAEPLREAARATPPEHLLVETDAPYLTPKPTRGKANASYLMAHTVEFLAELLGWGLPEFCDLVVDNTFRAFGGEWGDE